MKKGIIFVLLIGFLAFASVKTVFAFSSLGGFFGGRIIYPEATKIFTLEKAGFICPMDGTSVSIIPLSSPAGTPVDYFIPGYVQSKTGTELMPGQLILGQYSGGQTIITCFYFESFPFIDTEDVPLNTLNLFGTSAV
jgi:hypothetical protein